jgi:hypothetical protein
MGKFLQIVGILWCLAIFAAYFNAINGFPYPWLGTGKAEIGFYIFYLLIGFYNMAVGTIIDNWGKK